MNKIVFATGNPDKVKEIQKLLEGWEVLSLADLNFHEEIPEDYDTLEGNAEQKAQTIWDCFGLMCFADDTGLEVEALDGRPGVYSARYAGPDCSYLDNVNKMLSEMNGVKNRKAQFRTSICLILNGQRKEFFNGICEGEILHHITGADGFGYDPIFKPLESELSFAEMSLEAKNQISHRGSAVRKLAAYLKEINQ